MTKRPSISTCGMPVGRARGSSNVEPAADRVRVEEDQVGAVALADQAPVGQPQPGGGARGEVRDALLQGEHAQLPHVAAEILREGAVRARVRLVALEDAVAAAGVDAVPHDRPDVLLVADVLEDRRAEPVLDQQAAGGGPGRLAALGRRLPRPSCRRGRASAGSLTPEISMVSHSMGTPWQPSGALDLHVRAGSARPSSSSAAGRGPPPGRPRSPSSAASPRAWCSRGCTGRCRG